MYREGGEGLLAGRADAEDGTLRYTSATAASVVAPAYYPCHEVQNTLHAHYAVSANSD